MITHGEAIKALDGLAQFIIMNDTGTDESASAIEWHNIIKQSITEQQAKDKVHEELKRDVKRYFELQYGAKIGDGIDDTEATEYVRLSIKLMEVGKEKLNERD